MATFDEGQSYKDNRIHATGIFEQTGTHKNGKPMDGYNIAFSMSNDEAEGSDVFTDPMLKYDTYIDADGDPQYTFTVPYSKSQYEELMETANLGEDGKGMPVVNADLMPNPSGKGLLVNTKTMTTPENGFDPVAHKENTKSAREVKAQNREAANIAKAESSAEADSGLDK